MAASPVQILGKETNAVDTDGRQTVVLRPGRVWSVLGSFALCALLLVHVGITSNTGQETDGNLRGLAQKEPECATSNATFKFQFVSVTPPPTSFLMTAWNFIIMQGISTKYWSISCTPLDNGELPPKDELNSGSEMEGYGGSVKWDERAHVAHPVQYTCKLQRVFNHGADGSEDLEEEATLDLDRHCFGLFDFAFDFVDLGKYIVEYKVSDSTGAPIS